MFVLGATFAPAWAVPTKDARSEEVVKKAPKSAHNNFDMQALLKEAKSESKGQLNKRAKAYFLLIYSKLDNLSDLTTKLNALYKDITSNKNTEFLIVCEPKHHMQAKLENVDVPVIIKDTLSENLKAELSVFGETVAFISSKGVILDVGGFKLLSEWEDTLTRAKTKSKRKLSKKTAVSGSASPMYKKLIELSYGTAIRPNPKAKYYMLLMSARFCGGCTAAMPTIIKQYKELSKNNQLEIVLYGPICKLESLYYANKHDIPFPISYRFTPDFEEWVKEQERAYKAPTISARFLKPPLAHLFDSDGQLLVKSGQALDILNRWDEITSSRKSGGD